VKPEFMYYYSNKSLCKNTLNINSIQPLSTTLLCATTNCYKNIVGSFSLGCGI